MPRESKIRTIRCSLVGVMIIAVSSLQVPPTVAQQAKELPREQIGESLGKPVYRDDIRSDKNVTLVGELHRLFTSAAIAEYRDQHDKELTPTAEEIAASKKSSDEKHRERMKEQGPGLREKLKAIEEKLSQTELTEEEKAKLTNEKKFTELLLHPPGEAFAAWTTRQWKFQQHLYKKYGGGRLLFQQAGMEAFDANRKWLESLEAAGKFKITDPKLRSSLYEYWTRDHGHWIIDDKERIQEFIEPESLNASTAKK